MKWMASDLARALTEWSLTHERSTLHGPDVQMSGAHFDSRQIRPGQLFFALVAERDGHDFIGDALRSGAAGYVTSRPDILERIGGTAIVVPDTAIALRDAASWIRTQFPSSTVVVGITGSVGKTTTKDFVAAALSSSKRVAASPKSFNNEQGLPVTILDAPFDTEVLVLEMGMRGFRQIADLCRIARPSIGLVTRIGEAHTELVGGIEGVALAKGELVESLPPQGMAVLNADDPRVRALAARSVAPVVLYGEAADSDVRIEELVLDAFGRATFHVRTKTESVQVSLALPGRHMASNAAAALAVGFSLGLPLEPMARALASVTTEQHRMSIVHTRGGAILLDDCYNANPTSVSAALETLSTLDVRHRVAVLGHMAELSDPEEAHRRIIDMARSKGIRVLVVDTDSYGVPHVDVDEVISELTSSGSDTAILVKASRVAALERVVQGLTK